MYFFISIYSVACESVYCRKLKRKAVGIPTEFIRFENLFTVESIHIFTYTWNVNKFDVLKKDIKY